MLITWAKILKHRIQGRFFVPAEIEMCFEFAKSANLGMRQVTDDKDELTAFLGLNHSLMTSEINNISYSLIALMISII